MKLKCMQTFRRSRLVAVSAVMAMAVAATAVITSTASAHRAVAASGSISKSELAKLKKVVSSAQAAPKWTKPGPAVSAKPLKGKKLLVFPVNSEIGACTTQSQDFAALGRSLGAKVTLDTSTGAPSSWETDIEQATSGHYAGLAMMCGVIPQVVSPQLVAAEHAGVKVVDGNYNETNTYTDLDGWTAVNTAQGVQDDLADALVNLKGKPAHILYLDSSSIIQDKGAQAGLNSAIKQWCAKSCTQKDLNVEVQNWATPTEQSQVASALTANPDINTVIVTFDGMTPSVVSAVTGHAGIKIYAWGGSSSIEKLVQQGKVAADAAPDERWDAYDAMDQLIRLIGGHKAASVKTEVDPNVFFTKANVKSFFGPGGTYGDAAFGKGAFVKDFDTLWGVK
jgi:ABC-type sugar transport system substrate-binding protein